LRFQKMTQAALSTRYSSSLPVCVFELTPLQGGGSLPEEEPHVMPERQSCAP
jgi:hypothetical protein